MLRRGKRQICRVILTLGGLIGLTIVTSKLWGAQNERDNDAMHRPGFPGARVLRQETAESQVWNYNQDRQPQERYSLELDSNVVIQGIPFNIPELGDVDPPSNYVNISTFPLKKFVFVTWVTSGGLPQLKGLLLYLQIVFIGFSAIVFDLGLSSVEQHELGTFCSVTPRKFDLSQYPDHIQDLNNRAFRPILIRNVMMTEPAFLWVEVNQALPRRSTQWDKIYQKASNSDGIVQFRSREHNLSFHPSSSMLHRIPHKSPLRLSETGSLLLYRTKHVYNQLIHWWYMCALDVQCYTPQYRVMCPGKQRDKTCYYGDQISLDLLMDLVYRGNASERTFYQDTVERGPLSSYWPGREPNLNICKHIT